MLSKKLKQIIERDRINDRERLAAIKFMETSLLGLLLELSARMQQNNLAQNTKERQLCNMIEE